ncbi:hypothetical protein AAG614_08910 [Citromicrobium bathyomarinum]
MQDVRRADRQPSAACHATRGTGILSLFDDDLEAPEGLTIFDRAYLEAVYRLPATADDAQIHDATWTMYRRLERSFGESGAD